MREFSHMARETHMSVQSAFYSVFLICNYCKECWRHFVISMRFAPVPICVKNENECFFILSMVFVIPDKNFGILNTSIFILTSLFAVTRNNKQYYYKAFKGGNEPDRAYNRREYARYKEKTAQAHWRSAFIHGQTSCQYILRGR